jgi:hypothetical protein
VRVKTKVSSSNIGQPDVCSLERARERERERERGRERERERNFARCRSLFMHSLPKSSELHTSPTHDSEDVLVYRNIPFVRLMLIFRVLPSID